MGIRICGMQCKLPMLGNSKIWMSSLLVHVHLLPVCRVGNWVVCRLFYQENGWLHRPWGDIVPESGVSGYEDEDLCGKILVLHWSRRQVSGKHLVGHYIVISGEHIYLRNSSRAMRKHNRILQVYILMVVLASRSHYTYLCKHVNVMMNASLINPSNGN